MPNNTFNVTIDGKDYSKNIVYPIKWSKLLDERLDETRLSIKRIKRNIIPPLTPAIVTMTDKNGQQITLNTVVTTDESGEVPVGKGTYDHEIMCLEETKILEGIVVDALTFTNELERNYTGNAKPINVEQDTVSIDNNFQYINQNVLNGISQSLSPKESDTSFIFPAIATIFSPYKNHPSVSADTIMTWKTESMIVRYDDTDIYNYFYEYRAGDAIGADGRDINEDSFTVEKLKEGRYDVEYEIRFYRTLSNAFYTKVNFGFNVSENHIASPRWNIAMVIDRVLNLAEPHLAGVEPRFTLNAEQHAEFEKIEAPEFAFTNCTLKEILDQIGGYIHGIPRLKGNVIYFDMLGGTKQAKLSDPKYNYISNMYSQDIENYCTSLDSTVDNLVCLTDTAQGTITEPYYDGYKTVRTETVYARIEENNMYIATQFPIQQIQSIKCGVVPDKDFIGGDITEYVFEEAEYNRMSAYDDNYPTSKAYALYYTQGAKNIYGLGFKQIKAGGEATGNYAIINILEQTSGNPIKSLGKNYPLLSFQVSYTPVFSARVQQTKQYIGDFKEPRTLVYNQGANLVETRYYGENMKGAVARMGNVDRIVTYNLYDFSLIPEIGEMYGDDYYIAGVTCELHPNVIKCMLTLSQDFNRLSQYIGINSTKRFYEVSEKQAYRRDIKYADYIVIGDKVESDETLIQQIAFLPNTLHSGPIMLIGHTNNNPTYVIAQGYDNSGNPKTKVSLPIVSTAQGNAMVFTFAYEDNYSAGVQTQFKQDSGASGYFTNAVAYGNYYGRLKTLAFSMKHFGEGDKLELPYTTEDMQPRRIIGTDNNRLVVEKDGAEIFSVSYVLETVTNKRNYIIGSGFARNCSLVKNILAIYEEHPTLWVLPKRIPKFADKLDLTDATKIWDFYGGDYPHLTIPNTDKYIKLDDFISTVNGMAWAIATPSGEFYFGSNETITAGVRVGMPWMTLKHDIYNLQKK